MASTLPATIHNNIKSPSDELEVSIEGCDHDLHNLAVNSVVSVIVWLVESKYIGGYGHPIKFYPRAYGQKIILVIDINKHMCSSVLEKAIAIWTGCSLGLDP